MQRGYVVLVAAALWTATLGGCDSPKKTELPRILEEVKKLEDKVARAREGQSVDFDGDGFAEYTQSVAANGIRRVEIKNQDDKVRSTFTIWPDGSLLHTFSEYADGIVDFQEERTHGKTLKTYDTNRDGNFDRRVTFLPSDSPLFIRVIQEQLNNKNEWLSEESLQPTTLEWSTLPSPATQLLSYTPPSQAVPTPVAFTFGFHFIQNSENQKDGCTLEETEKLLGALADISQQSLGCLALTNPLMADVISNALSGEHTVNVYCGFESEPDFMALPTGRRAMAFARAGALQHGAWACNINTPCTLKFNRDFLHNTTLPPNEFQHALLHEFLHTLGFDVDNAENHNQTSDKVSSCARYCSGCAVYGTRTTPNPNADCAYCASTQGKKEMCGYQIAYPLGSPEGASPICGQAPSGQAFVCNQSHIMQYLYCDGSPANNMGGSWYCCEDCPVENTMAPCGDNSTINLCNEAPPACR